MSPLVLLDLANGRFRTTLESFCREGKKEGCAFSPDFDASFYIASNRLRLEENALTSASAGWHFLTVGAASGLQSSPYFDPSYYLQRYPGVAETCRQLGISPIEDFVMFGKNEARKPGRPLADRHVDIFQAKAIYERRALDSLIRLSNYPLDFTDFCGDDPILSVVVPVHNLASFTARFLELAYYSCAELKRRTGANSEIVIVSNGSDDTTDQVLKTMRGVRSLISAEAMGFTRAANWGAEGASGRYLLIANNDIEFAPGTFADLISSFESTANCGVLGARILSMDMTIQEMGAFVARDGTTGGIERGSRLTHHYGCRKRAVDYVSGCFLCIQRADFEAVGGFDEAFSPGYYEEVDLCLRIAETMGKQILVDPTLSIQHYENASFTSGRPPAALYPLVLRNRHTIMRKHPSISRGPSLNQLLGGAAGGASARRTKMLVILDTIPDSRPESSSARNAVILSIFRELEIPYDLLALRPASEVDDYAFPDVAVYRAWMPSESVWDLLNGEIGAYSHIWVGGTGNLNNLVDHLHRYKNLHHARIICDSEMIRFPQSEGAPASTEEQPVDPAEIDLVTAQFSRAAVADHLVTTTEHQASLIRSVGFDSVSVVGHRASIISDGVGEESLVKQVQGVLQETGAWADEPCTA
jgi:GT2 family glycosyltransferase